MICSKILFVLPDRSFIQLSFFIHHLRFNLKYKPLNFNFIQTFPEKINYLKLYNHHDYYSLLADKYLVRNFVKSKIGANYLIPMIGYYDDVNDINFNDLPNEFILKTNHGSGWNIICDDKNNFNFNEARKQLKIWMKWNAFFLSREKHYKKIIPKIICEKFLGSNIMDYKVFCFNGKPKFIQLDLDRRLSHKRIFYDINWNEQDFSIIYDKSDKKIDKPDKLQELLELATKLSRGLIFCRVDFYIVNNCIYFGEITLHPEGGNCTISNTKYDLILSKNIKIEDIEND